MRAVTIDCEPLLTPAEVAGLWNVDVKNVRKWADRGLLATIRTPGDHRRYSEAQVMSWFPGGHPGALLQPCEAARELGTDNATLRKWSLAGRLGCWRTPQGHRRYSEAEVAALKAARQVTPGG